MEFALDHGEAALVERAQQVGEDLAAVAAGGPPGRVNRAVVAGLAESGLLDTVLGPAGSAMSLCLVRQGLARSSSEVENALAIQSLGAWPLRLGSAPALAERYLPELAGGTMVAAFALTEPGAGSDAAALEMTAEQDGNGYRLSGRKAFISNAPDADLYAVFARTGGERSRGVTAFVVEGGSAGLSGAPVEILGGHPIGHLTFDAVFVPGDNVLSDEGAGFRLAMATLDLFRPSVGAMAVGLGEAALGLAIAHAVSRRAFDRPIGEFQGVSHRLAEMATRLEAARLLVYRAASLHDRGEGDITAASAMAKLYATETAQEVVDGAIQILGARGLEKGHLLAHLYDVVRAPRIYEGTSEIQRSIIAKRLLSGGSLPG
jgi:alkylation response protein AidB-like acyl-CoA dehydrogenase